MKSGPGVSITTRAESAVKSFSFRTRWFPSIGSTSPIPADRHRNIAIGAEGSVPERIDGLPEFRRGRRDRPDRLARGFLARCRGGSRGGQKRTQ
jgi:hypothetical protein